MADQLEQIHQEIFSLQKDEQLNLNRTIETAARAAQLMVDEVSDWHVIIQDLPAAAGLS